MDETEQRILDAAMSVFANEGYEGATTRKIAEMAGVNEVTLFRRFQSKENILRQIIIRNRDTILQTLDQIFLTEKEEDLAAGLRSRGLCLMRFMKERIDLMNILIAEGRKKPEVASILNSVLQAIIAHLCEYFEFQISKGKMRNVNPKMAALTYFSHLCYISQLRGVIDDDILGDGEEEFYGFIDIFINGIVNTEHKCTR